MPLTLKNFYSLKDASNLLNHQLNRNDIDSEFFIHLALNESINLSYFPTYDLNDEIIGTIIFDNDDLQFLDLNQRETRICLNLCFHYITQKKFSLVLTKNSIYDLYQTETLPLTDIRFNNIYSVFDNTLAIPPEFQSHIGNFRFFKNLGWDKFYKVENVPASSINANYDDSMVATIWFDYFDYSFNNKPMKKVAITDVEKNISISTDNLYILSADLEKILSGKIESNTYKIINYENFNLMNFLETKSPNNSNLHPKAYNSYIKIIAGLALYAKIDLSNHQTAFKKIQDFCDLQGIEIPNKDTCGKWFKEASEYIKNSI